MFPCDPNCIVPWLRSCLEVSTIPQVLMPILSGQQAYQYSCCQSTEFAPLANLAFTNSFLPMQYNFCIEHDLAIWPTIFCLKGKPLGDTFQTYTHQ